MNTTLEAHIPSGALENKWSKCKEELRQISENQRKDYTILVVGTGLAGSSAAATLAEMGYKVIVFCISDSPRRAHSVAAQGGINAAKNYRNDGDSVQRLFEETLKGGDYRSREANVYRLAQLSNLIIDHCVAQGVPFARDYDGYLANRSFGGTKVSRTFYARGQTGQQLLLGAYASMNRQVAKGNITVKEREEMLDLVLVDGRAQGIITRNLVTGQIERYAGHAVVLATGGYGNVYFLSTNAMNSNASAIMQCYRKGAFFANPCYAQIHPTCIPVHGEHQSKLTLMSESLRNDGRIWVPKKLEDVQRLRNGSVLASHIPEEDRDYYLERRYPAYKNLVPRDIASRAAKERCDAGFGVNSTGRAVFLDFKDALKKLGRKEIDEKYGNLFQMYEKITGQNPYEEPMMIYPAIHYTMGGLWVDYHLMTTIDGLFAIGEANFSDHGANRLGASALMQGLADGYFVLPPTMTHYLACLPTTALCSTDHPEFTKAHLEVQQRINGVLNMAVAATFGPQDAAYRRTPTDTLYRQLGHLMWEKVGMSRNRKDLEEALANVDSLEAEFEKVTCVPGVQYGVNQELEKALRVKDFFDLARIMIMDAIERAESCGGHFREESQTPDGETLRNDREFSYVSAWEYTGEDKVPVMHKEPIHFEFTELSQRNYK